MELPKNGNGTNDWVEYRRLVLGSIDAIETDISLLSVEQIKIRLDIRELKVRAALWGGVAGGLIGLAGIALQYFLNV